MERSEIREASHKPARSEMSLLTSNELGKNPPPLPVSLSRTSAGLGHAGRQADETERIGRATRTRPRARRAVGGLESGRFWQDGRRTRTMCGARAIGSGRGSAVYGRASRSGRLRTRGALLWRGGPDHRRRRRQGAGAEACHQRGELPAEATQMQRDQHERRQVAEAPEATRANRLQHHLDDAGEGFGQGLGASVIHGDIYSTAKLTAQGSFSIGWRRS